MIARVLLAIARVVLKGVISMLAKQLLRVAEEAIRPMQSVADMLSGDNDVWRGAGAQKFVEVVQSMLIPGVQTSHDQIQRLKNNLDTACDTIDQADGDSEQIVRSRLFDRMNFYTGS